MLTLDPGQFVERHFVYTTFGRIRQLVECNVWSKGTVGINLYFAELCLKFVQNWSKISNIYQEKKTEVKKLYFEFSRQVFGQFFT